MGIKGRRTTKATIEIIIAMRLRGLSYRAIARALLISTCTVYAHANRKVIRERRRLNEAAARARYQVECDRISRDAERIRSSGGGSIGGFLNSA